MAKEIKVSPNSITVVDDEDYEYLSQWKWYLSNGYAVNEKRKKMHRLITLATSGELVDHADRDKLNNRRYNLRIVGKCENVHNQNKRINTSNTFKGTNYIKRLGLWQSRCRIYGGDYFLGYYRTEIAAAYAYNKKASALSPFALLNDLGMDKNILEQMLVDNLATIPDAEYKSSVKGVYYHKKTKKMKCGKWNIRIKVDGKIKCYGGFLCEQDAIDALHRKSGNAHYTAAL